MQEVWKEITGFEGYYAVSNFGRVKTVEHLSPYKKEQGKYQLIKEKLKSLGTDRDGYKTVMLYKGSSVRKLAKVHRLVAEAFIPNPDKFPMVNHKDETKNNNCVSNLEWCDWVYNNNYGTRNKRLAETKKAAGFIPTAYRDPKTGRFSKKEGDDLSVFQF